MRREHHPYWAEQILARMTQRWVEHFLLPHFDAVGKEPRFSGAKHIQILGPSVRVGDYFHAFATREEPISLAVNPYDGGAGEIVFGDCCVLSSGARIRSAASVRIGSSCMFAENCFITDADWHDAYHRIYPGKKEPVRIGDNVWLGDSVSVCKGVTIGDNCIVGAASVVTRDLPHNTIAAGNPAKKIGELDPKLPTTPRAALFLGGTPYEEFKAAYDTQRLHGNTLIGWLRSMAFPDRDT